MMNNLLATNLLLDKAPLLILILDAEQRVQFINDWGCKIIGYKRDEVLGKNWIDVYVVNENKDQIKSYFNAVIQQQSEIIGNFESCIRTAQGDVLFFSWNSELLPDSSGKPHALFSIGEDVTDKKILLKKLLSQEAINRSQLNRAIEKAKESERDDIAAELHDNINQSLTTCKLLLEQELQGNNNLPFAGKAFDILKETINEIRNLSHRISSGLLSFSDLEQSLKNSLEEIHLATGLHTHLSITGNQALNNAPISIIANIFRIIQEQLNNIVKHAHASSIHISLQADSHAINLEIKDNGKGFDLNGVKKGLGLNSIFRRAEINQGTVYVDSAPGQGCLLSVFIPFE